MKIHLTALPVKNAFSERFEEQSDRKSEAFEAFRLKQIYINR